MAFEQYGNRLYCRRPGPEGDYCVTVRDGKVILTLPDDNDIFQLWYKDFSDDDCYMLRNKATSKVVKYSGVGDQLELVNKPSVIVEKYQSVLWTNSKVERNDEFSFIRTSRNVELVMDAWTGHITEGTLVSIYPNVESDNELWKFIPYSPPNYKLYCKRQGQGDDYCVSVRHGKLVLALPEDDITQIWYTDNYDNGFMLINKASGKSVQHSDVGVQLELVDKPHDVDQSVLWTNSEDLGDGYTFIRTKSDVNLVMDAWEGHISNGTLVSIYPNAGSDNEYWKLVPYSPPVFQLFLKKGCSIDLYVGVRQDKLSLTIPDDRDKTQLWYIDDYDNGSVLVHKASEKFVRYFGIKDQLALMYKPELGDASFLWTITRLLDEAHIPVNGVVIRTCETIRLVMVTGGGVIGDGTPITVVQDSDTDRMVWIVKYYVPIFPPGPFVIGDAA